MNSEYRLLPVALAPHIKDALVETGGCFMPETVWAAIIAAHDLVSRDAPQHKSIRDYPDFREDLERLSEPGLAKAQAKVIRRAIYDTIDARVRNLSAAQSKASAAPVLTDAGWQPIETAPNCGEFLAYHPTFSTKFWVTRNSSLDGFTHWMPLPAAPVLAATPAKTEGM